MFVGGNQMSRFYCREDELRKMNKRYDAPDIGRPIFLSI